MQRFALSAILALIFASGSQGQTSRSTASCFNRISYRHGERNINRTGTDYDLANTNARAGEVNTDFEFLTNISEGLLREFDKAWRSSGGGINGHEGVVLIFRKPDGTYTGRSQGVSNEYHMFTFKWSFNAVAIVHTHPNGTDPRPGEQDKRVADKYCVPNFTLTRTGMYVYDPATKRTSKVFNGLDWLKLPTYPDELKGWLGSERRTLLPSGF